jgi:hypothetical protein
MAKKEKFLEDAAIRVMYFLNTMDSFLIFSAMAYYLCSALPLLKGNILVSFAAPPPAVLFFMIVLYLGLKCGDFYPSFLLFIPAGMLLLAPLDREMGAHLISIVSVIFIYTSCVQIIFMGIPMSLAARKPDIPFRMYLNSFLILSPTTMSMPLTVIYLTFIIYGSRTVSGALTAPFSLFFLGAFVIACIIVHRTKRTNMPLVPHHPEPSGAIFKRVMLLNIDGLSSHALEKSGAGFLKAVERVFCSIRGGARTVFRALTNPAFVSIMTGADPATHGVTSNNVGQKIRVEALPDFIETRLYGSMHVRHFSRESWNVKVFSLVELGFREADEAMMEELRQDIIENPSTALWIADLSQADYAGHAWGGYSRRHYEAIERIDSLIRDFILWLEAQGLLDDSLIIISSDHGLFIAEHSFLLSAHEEYVPLMFIGKGIFPGEFSFPVSIMDICANIAYFLGQRYCKSDRGRVFEDIHKAGEGSDAFSMRVASVTSQATNRR